MTDEAKKPAEAGALPALDAKPVLGPPKVTLKSKSNVGKLFYLLGGLGAFIFIIFGLIAFLKHRDANKTPAQQQAGPVVAATSKKNDRVESQSIETMKLRLKEKDAQAAAVAARAASAASAAAAASAATSLADYDRPAGGQAPGAQAGAAAAPGQRGAPSAPGAPARTVVAAPKPLTPEERAMSGDVMVGMPSDGGRSVRGEPGQVKATPASVSSADGSDAFSSSFKPTVFAAGRAGHPSNRDFLLEQGDAIPCALLGGIDTTLPGPVECQVIQDIYSSNGLTKLVDRGAHVFGEQRSGLKDGQRVVAVLWDRIHSGDVWIDVDSPGVDQMGYNGVPVDVDMHWSERIGAALMLSVIDDYAEALAAKQSQSNGSGPTYNNTTQTGQSMAGEVLKHQIGIPPTGYQKPGKTIYIRMVRDVSFENVYALER